MSDYEFSANEAGELLLALKKPEGEVDKTIAKIIYVESEASAVLVRNKNNQVCFSDLPDELCEMLKDGRKTILVAEVLDEDENADTYDVPLEMKGE